jgi:hypothetical protein
MNGEHLPQASLREESRLIQCVIPNREIIDGRVDATSPDLQRSIKIVAQTYSPIFSCVPDGHLGNNGQRSCSNQQEVLREMHVFIFCASKLTSLVVLLGC